MSLALQCSCDHRLGAIDRRLRWSRNIEGPNSLYDHVHVLCVRMTYTLKIISSRKNRELPSAGSEWVILFPLPPVCGFPLASISAPRRLLPVSSNGFPSVPSLWPSFRLRGSCFLLAFSVLEHPLVRPKYVRFDVQFDVRFDVRFYVRFFVRFFSSFF